jgi:hypothetical protein
MKRYAPYTACIAGIITILLLLPRFNPAQPRGIRLTRGEAMAVADAAARKLGIPVDQSWPTLGWNTAGKLNQELRGDPQRRARAWDDPVIGPRLGSYRRIYYWRGKDKNTPHGLVDVDGRTGQVLDARVTPRDEETGKHATEAELRPRADAFVRSRNFDGAPSPQFESARPTVMRTRTDWVFRYRVPTSFRIGDIVPYLNVYFAGDRFAGWQLSEEYSDGRPFSGDSGGAISGVLLRFAVTYALLIFLLFIFLKKYHAGEVGVGTASMLFALLLALLVIGDFMLAPSFADNTGLGSVDAQKTGFADIGFKFVIFDLPLALVVFFGWAVGESYARERWGERLASFDALLRHDALNATVGRSVVRGALTAPAVAAAAFLVGAIPLALKIAYPDLGGSEFVLGIRGPMLADLFALTDAIIYPIATVLFLLAFAHRKRMLPAGIAAAIVLSTIGGAVLPPIMPALQNLLFGWGAAAACVAVFLGCDLLAAAVALGGASILVCTAPLISVARGAMLVQLSAVAVAPLVVIVGFGIAALMTGREVVYSYEDLAPHVKRIVERERVKAEIDAANRIQSALLPLESPQLTGASVASHYRAATEIGGDYFDFLTLRSGEMGIAFGDVSGHGLTSGIVMAMAKAALLVQVEVDPSPRVVMDVLNDIVIKTAPKRIMMTFFFGVLDSATQQLRFSSAGHLDPYVYRADGGRLEALSSWGFPLGVRRRDPFREHAVGFAPGDRLILYSDGLIEALDDDGNPFGFDRFEQVLRACGPKSAEEIKKTLLQSIRKFTRNRPPEDDQTLVVVSFEEEVAGEAIA